MGANRPVSSATDPIRIHVGRQSDGCTYDLHPRSRARIRDAYPQARLASQVFVGFDTQVSYDQTQGPLWEQIAMLLTGLTHEQLQALGGVEVYDPVTRASRSVEALAS